MLTVTKSNELIEAKYKLSLEEQRLILYLVSLINPKDEDFKKYEIRVDTFSQIANLTKKTQYAKFKNICNSLMTKTITIKEDHEILMVSWLASARYHMGTGAIILSFAPDLKPYLLQLKKSFTSYKLLNIIYLKSVYSIRIFELLKQYQQLSYRIFNLDELKEILCVSQSYKLYGDFKKKVILVAQKELREKCDISFEFEEIKEGRKVAKIKFIINSNEIKLHSARQAEDNISEGMEEELLSHFENINCIRELRKVIKEPLSDKELLAIFEAAEGSIESIKSRYETAKNKRGVDNLTGFMIWACRQPDDQFETIKSRGKNKFNNFDGREWNFEELEKKEKEYINRLLYR